MWRGGPGSHYRGNHYYYYYQYHNHYHHSAGSDLFLISGSLRAPALAFIEAMEAGQLAATTATAETITHLADELFIQSERIERAIEDIEDLGSPPPEWEDGIRTMLRGMQRTGEAMATASRGARQGDLGLLTEGLTGITEGGLLFTEATGQMNPCDT